MSQNVHRRQKARQDLVDAYRYYAQNGPRTGGIGIVRVLHGARDIHDTLAEEFRIDGDDGGPDESTI
jgi:plasmid stabilization system protein ParE